MMFITLLFGYTPLVSSESKDRRAWRVKPEEMPTALPTHGEGDEGEVHYELFRSPQNTLLSTSKQGSFSRAASSWRRHRCACQPALTVPRTCGQAIRGM